MKYGKEREVKHWKSGKPYKIRPVIRRWRKVNTHYECGLCLRRFDERMAKEAYLDKEEKEEFIRLLNHYGLTQIVQRIKRIQTPIHIKSDLGKLYQDLRNENFTTGL